jgi:hypothetical protein
MALHGLKQMDSEQAEVREVLSALSTPFGCPR